MSEIDTSGIGVAPSWSRKLRAFVLGKGKTTAANLTDRLADVYEERTALLLDRPLQWSWFHGSAVSYRALQRLACRAANALSALGVRRGDRIALATLNRIELAFVELGAQRLGAIPVPVNFMLTLEEMRVLVERSGARVLVLDRGVLERTVRDRAALPTVERFVLVTTKPVPDGFASFDLLMSTASDHHDAVDLADDDPAIIFFTAGTTGLPKGAVLTSGGLMVAVRRYAALAALAPTARRQIALAVMPLAHTGGHQLLLIHLALAIPSLVLGSFDPERVLDLIERHRITMFAGIPTMFRMLLDAGAERRDLSSIVLFGGGGEAFPADLVSRLRALGARRRGPFRVPALVLTGYGLAETAGQVTVAPGSFGGDGCVGWFLPGVAWRLVDAEGRDVPRGDVGELWVKSPGLMREYWADPEGTRGALDGGWLRTGDLMRRGRFGLTYFVSREKEMIKVGGYSVFPAEVELAIEAHPDVERAVVVGLPHETKGELPVAAIVRRSGSSATEQELAAWMTERIAAYRCPRRVVFVDAVPLGFAMKPLRREVRARLLAMGVTVQSRAEQARIAP